MSDCTSSGVFNASVTVLLLALLCPCAGAGERATAIEWDRATLRLIERSADYGRMVRLKDGSTACVYDRDRQIRIRRGDAGGMRWQESVVIAREEGAWLTNASALALRDGTLLCFWNERPLAPLEFQQKPAPPGTLTRPFLIRMARSDDLGKTWSTPQTLYAGGVSFQDGCWEPAGLELPSGEVQVYFSNEAPFTASDEQEIALLRSFDAGRTWGKAERIALRQGHRDGMPSPLLLPSRREIVVAIEDNGLAGGRFKPGIFRTSLEDNWRSGPVSGQSDRREMALVRPLPPEWYGGAPFLAALPSGEVLLSYQESADGTLDRCRMAVCIAGPDARSFARKSYPLDLDRIGNQAWNSLFVKDDDTVIAVMTATAGGVRGVYAIDGRVIRGSCAATQKSP